MKHSTFALLCALLPLAPLPAAVTVDGQNGKFSLQVDGQPFFIKGVTYAGGSDAAQIESDLREIKALGANTIRNWGCNDEDTPKLLAAAEKVGLKVMLGLWLRHGRPGAEDDDSFNWLTDTAGRDKQMADTIRYVEAFKNSPALLCWGAGNEVILNIETEEEKVAYAKFLEQVAQEVKKRDPHHPVASVSAWTIDWPYWEKYCPSLDIYASNVYGYAAAAIPDEAKKLGVKKPYMITEFGVRGEWEIQPDANGVKLDPGDKERYEVIANGWKDLIEAKRPLCLGAFVFHFSDSFDHTSLWLAFKSKGAIRPPYWGARKAFTGEDPTNWPPSINDFMVAKASETKTPGAWTRVRLEVTDKEKNPLDVRFAYLKRDGWRDTSVEYLAHTASDRDGQYWVKMPETEGAFKLYALVRDTHPNLSVAVISAKTAKAN